MSSSYDGWGGNSDGGNLPKQSEDRREQFNAVWAQNVAGYRYVFVIAPWCGNLEDRQVSGFDLK
jgi:hypothetical protein